MELNLARLAQEWKDGRFRPVYYLIGEEAAAKAEALAQLKGFFKADDFNFAEFSGDIDSQAAAIVSEALTIPVFSERRLVVVNNSKLAASARAVFTEYLKKPSPTTTLVLFSEEKRSDLKDALTQTAATAGALCVFQPLRAEDARMRLQEEARRAGKELTEEAAAALIEEAGTDWTLLRQELEKAVLYAGGSPKITRESALECLGYQKAVDPFALNRLILGRDLKVCIAHLRRMFRDGKPDDQAFKALNQIQTSVQKQYRGKKLQRAGAPAEEIFRALKLNKYWDKDYLEGLKNFTEARLHKDLRRCVATEAALKSKTWLDAKMELEHLLVDLCRSAGRARPS